MAVTVGRRRQELGGVVDAAGYARVPSDVVVGVFATYSCTPVAAGFNIASFAHGLSVDKVVPKLRLENNPEKKL